MEQHSPTNILKLAGIFFAGLLIGTISMFILISRSQVIEPSPTPPTVDGQNTRRTCYYKNVKYANGDTFKDDCNSCECHEGLVQCSQKRCVTTTPPENFPPSRIVSPNPTPTIAKKTQCAPGLTPYLSHCSCTWECAAQVPQNDCMRVCPEEMK